jgi:hypothetical protein
MVKEAREKYIDLLKMHEIRNEKQASKQNLLSLCLFLSLSLSQKLLTRQFFILYGSRDRFKLGIFFLFSCAVLNRKAMFDVIWPRCQQCAAL